ncbi:DnaA N-terminal domain-containing protein [Roseobacter sp. A03A-229]
MFSTRPVGRGASARKYDLLTALGAYALSQSKHDQRRALRLMTLITARYNWARDELAVGQREIAQLWSVDERTVKREMAMFRAKGWLVVRRQGARGRVTQYGLGIDTLLEDTAVTWGCVGPDFELRMGGQGAAEPDVVPLPVPGAVSPPDVSSGAEWALAQALLHAEDPGTYASWIAALARAERAGGRLTLRAPSRFHAAYVQTHLAARLLTACQDVDGEVSELRIVT